MNFLKNLAEQDFVSETGSDDVIEVLVKKEYNPIDNTKEYICIRKDYLMILNDMFNDTEEALKKAEKQLKQIEIIINGI